MKKFLPILLLALCLCFPALAEEAADITGKCEISSSYYRNTFRVNDGKPKPRFDKGADGEPKNTLCEGLYRYFHHTAPYMQQMKALLERGQSPAFVMPWARARMGFLSNV